MVLRKGDPLRNKQIGGSVVEPVEANGSCVRSSLTGRMKPHHGTGVWY